MENNDSITLGGDYLKICKKHRIILCLIIVIILIVSVIFCCNNIYLSNNKIKNYYYDNSEVLNQYINNFDVNTRLKNIDDYFGKDAIISEEDETRWLYKIPDNLSEIGIESIEYKDNCVCFEFESMGAYCNAVYYSIDGEPIKDCPGFYIESENKNQKFRDVGKEIFINGKKNNGTDWYKTEKIDGNWYYYELHQA